jgi:hypothetical protein
MWSGWLSRGAVGAGGTELLGSMITFSDVPPHAAVFSPQ